MAQEAISALVREKRNVQRQYIEARRGALLAARQSGLSNGSDFTRENLELLNLELEMAETPAERRTILEKMLKEARTLEEVQQDMQRTGTGDATDILKAKVRRLDIQIQFEEAKSK